MLEKKKRFKSWQKLKNQLSFRLKKLLSSFSWRLNMYRFLTQRAAQLTVRDVLCVWHRQNHQLDINDFNYSFFSALFLCSERLFGWKWEFHDSPISSLFFTNISHKLKSSSEARLKGRAHHPHISSAHFILFIINAHLHATNFNVICFICTYLCSNWIIKDRDIGEINRAFDWFAMTGCSQPSTIVCWEKNKSIQSIYGAVVVVVVHAMMIHKLLTGPIVCTFEACWNLLVVE